MGMKAMLLRVVKVNTYFLSTANGICGGAEKQKRDLRGCVAALVS